MAATMATLDSAVMRHTISNEAAAQIWSALTCQRFFTATKAATGRRTPNEGLKDPC